MSDPADPMRDRAAGRWDAALIFAAALFFYSVTLAPAVIWGDSAFLAIEVLRGSLHFGTAGDHPLFVLLGRGFTAMPGDPARNLNFAAAWFGALTVALVYLCARELRTTRLAAATGAAALLVSHIFWLHSVIAEVYTTNAFFMAAVVWCLLKWRTRRLWRIFAASGALLAIGLTNHLVLIAVLPAAIVFSLAVAPKAFLSRTCVLSLVGIGLVVIGLAGPQRLFAVLERAWVGPPGISEYFSPQIAWGPMAREIGYYTLFLAYQFPSISLALGLAGAAILWRHDRNAALLLLVAVAVNAGVFIHHTAWQGDRSTKLVFYMTDYVVFAIFCAVGADKLLQVVGSTRARATGLATFAAVALLPPAIYAAVPVVVARAGIDLVAGAREIPYRDNAQYFLNPNKRGDIGARRFAEEVMRMVPPGAAVFADYTPFAVLRYLQLVEQQRLDVLLVGASEVGRSVPVTWTMNGNAPRATYLATWSLDYYDLSGLVGGYQLVPAGPIVEVRAHDSK